MKTWRVLRLINPDDLERSGMWDGVLAFYRDADGSISHLPRIPGTLAADTAEQLIASGQAEWVTATYVDDLTELPLLGLPPFEDTPDGEDKLFDALDATGHWAAFRDRRGTIVLIVVAKAAERG